MDDAKKLLRNWRQSLPKDGVKCEDLSKVVKFLGMTWDGPRSSGHYHAIHDDLKGSVKFPLGFVLINCHAFGVQGKAHPRAVRDIMQAEKIIEAARQKKQQDNEDNTEQDS